MDSGSRPQSEDALQQKRALAASGNISPGAPSATDGQPSAAEGEVAKKRPRSSIVETLSEETSSKKPRELESGNADTTATSDAGVAVRGSAGATEGSQQREEHDGRNSSLSAPAPSATSPSLNPATESTKESTSMAGGSGINPTGASSSVEVAPATPSKDEPVEGPKDGKSTSEQPHAASAQQPSSLRPDLVAAILGSPSKTPVKEASSAPPVAPIPQPPAPRQESKKKKRKALLRKVLRAKKEIEIAENVVDGKTDLARLLPEKDCRFLGGKLWIFTAQQLRAVLDGKEENEKAAREELLNELCKSDLISVLDDSTAQVNVNGGGATAKNNEGDDRRGDEKGEISSSEGKLSAETKSGDEEIISSINGGGLDSNTNIERVVEKSTDDLKQARGSGSKPGENVQVQTNGMDVDIQKLTSGENPDPKSNIESKTDTNVNVPGGTSAEAPRDVMITKVSPVAEGKAIAKKPETASTANGSGDTVQLDPSKLQGALALMESWRRALLKMESLESTERTKQFFLDGPISALIPKCTQNFLRSVKIVSAFDFLTHKRTETGILVDMYISWRKECSLSEITRLTIARHLVGLGARIELAIGSSCPPNIAERTWVGTQSVVLGGASKEFLFDIKVFDSDVFLNTKTKDLSEQLADWRVAQGLAPLKGTGKVAMISAWKTQVREAKEAEEEDGKVLGEQWYSNLNFEDSNENQFLTAKPKVIKTTAKSNVKTVAKKPEKSPSPAKEETPIAGVGKVPSELESKAFLATVLSKGTIKILDAVGVKTAGDLLNVEDGSPTLDAIAKELKNYSGGLETDTPSNDHKSRIVAYWQQQVKSKLAANTRKAKASPINKESPKLMKSQEDRAFSRKKIEDPWDALSDSSKVFLKSIGVNDAESFLAAKTKDLAEALVKYREDNNMPPLKGLGSVASISGWKALVRSAAKKVGQHDLVTLNAGRNAGIKLAPRKAKPEEGQEVETVSVKRKAETPKQSQTAVPVTKARKPVVGAGSIAAQQTRFWVIGGGDAFCFVLSLRTCSYDESRRSPYLTYLGCDKMRSSDDVGSGKMRPSLPVLENVFRPAGSECRETKPFSSLRNGLIEIGRYGMLPRPRRDDLGLIKRLFRAYIFQEELSDPVDEKTAYNVFENHGELRKMYYFYQKTPIEKGQTVELNFLPPTPPELFGSNDDIKWRNWIAKEVESLEMKDLRTLLDFLNDDILAVVDRDMHRRIQTDAATIDFDPEKLAPELSKLVIARRRMHWLVLKINSALQIEMKKKAGGTILLPPVSFTPLWKEQLVELLQKHPAWKARILPLLVAECKQEILAEFRSATFGDFSATNEMWCRISKEAFNETVRIFSHFSAELRHYCTEGKLLEDLMSVVSSSVSKLKVYQDRSAGNGYDGISLPFRREISHSSNVFPPSEVLWAKLNQNYLDSMALCCEPPKDLSLVNQGSFVAVISSEESNDATKSEDPDLLSVRDLYKEKYTIDIDWYIRAQVIAVIECAALCGVAHIATTGPSALSEIREKIQFAAKAALQGEEIAPLKLRAREQGVGNIAVPLKLLDGVSSPICRPGSEPFFLCIVWPILKKMKWRAEAGPDPSSVTFSFNGKKNNKRERVMKQEAARARSKYARMASEMGLGCIPKAAKRLFILCAASKDDTMQDDTRPLTVAEALEAFEKSFDIAKSPEDRTRIGLVVGHLATLFDCVAPSLSYHSEGMEDKVSDRTPWKDALGCEYLMRFLLVAPKLLSHLDLTVAQREYAVGVMTDLIDFLVQNHKKVFSRCFHLPAEEYDADFEFKKLIAAHLDKSEGGDEDTGSSSPVEDMTEVVLPSDRADLTDFVCTVMDQLVVCKATREDMHVKGRRASYLTVGTPGLMCRHCSGEKGEGKYFYSNPQSLATASTSADKHILRCPKTSDEIKQQVLAAKSRQAVQRGQVPVGAQSAFFSRLWKRLQGYRRSSRLPTDDMYVTLQEKAAGAGNNKDSDEKSETSSAGTEFHSHVDLLNYLLSEEPWKSNDELGSAIAKYHSGLAWGASIYNTPAMPAHYSSEWILGKLGHEARPHQHH